jgi:hypothetical protein
MAIALAEADKYEVLEKIGRCSILSALASAAYYTNTVATRLRLLWHHSQSEAEKRRLRKSKKNPV